MAKRFSMVSCQADFSALDKMICEQKGHPDSAAAITSDFILVVRRKSNEKGDPEKRIREKLDATLNVLFCC